MRSFLHRWACVSLNGGMALCVRALAILCLFLPSSCGSDDTHNVEPASAPVAKIMPLGDSITESAAGQWTYRYFLWHRVKDAGYRIDFVGSMRGAYGGSPVRTDFDMDHEGHSGWRADQILDFLVGGAAAVASPDIVLLHLGTNDLCQGQDIPGTIDEISRIIDLLRKVNPAVAVVLAQSIPSTHGCHAEMPAFVAKLPDLAATKGTTVSPVMVVDQHHGFDPTVMTWDGLHPNRQGESQMADRWFAALRSLLDSRFLARP
ncbi:MAG: hypothetical protein A4E19_03375 [Nitrospira sp. SG-bin1]|nr:MAG: hypothetical protein A4E19_03375 [Nitrospira sp. SG-bin1]